ncbi:hypothetical protein KIL84_000128 [Mauremys mutica]|uniref:Uncharacterized protein n=1 Tax=Mauremys mutica TaxID=74926 RepID=A0A9D4AWB9_9SAUR|nr:hypothetical protein KIL84_000128 [Mauremys mutica]
MPEHPLLRLQGATCSGKATSTKPSACTPASADCHRHTQSVSTQQSPASRSQPWCSGLLLLCGCGQWSQRPGRTHQPHPTGLSEASGQGRDSLFSAPPTFPFSSGLENAKEKKSEIGRAGWDERILGGKDLLGWRQMEIISLFFPLGNLSILPQAQLGELLSTKGTSHLSHSPG